MCGICGIVDNSTSGRVEEKLIRRMASRLEHRGPDDEGVYIGSGNPGIGLGHRRLSIIDLSTAGHQPIANEDKSIWLVLNGEIYNYELLRRDLQGKGHIFASDTDTETILHLYEEYNEGLLQYLRGMFAFALWDNNKKKLLLARDRVGKKPLLYSYKNGIFCFASEFASLLESGHIRKNICCRSIDSYLKLGYIPAPFTIYEDVYKLLPGHYLVLKNNDISVVNYWDLDYGPKLSISQPDAQLELLHLLRESVRMRLRSDVPIGAFLSGGVDSSAVVALMSQVSEKKVKTFSIGFVEKDYNELKYASNIARRYQTDHHELIVRPNVLNILPLIVERYGEPYADSSCIPTYYMSEQTKKHVTVVLSGDGGDELFAGYERYHAMVLAQMIQRLPWPVLRVIYGAGRLLPDQVDPKNRLRRLKRFLEAASLPVNDRYLKWVSIINDDLRNELYSSAFKGRISASPSCNDFERWLNHPFEVSLLDRLLSADMHIYLPDDLLVKVDIASMANSLEVRSPLLDHKLMEFAARLPVDFKLKGSVKKFILKKALSGLLPNENIYRRKMGFGVPIRQWLRKELNGFLRETLLNHISLNRGYFDPEAVKGLIKSHSDGKKDYSSQLWSLLMLELWHRRFID